MDKDHIIKNIVSLPVNFYARTDSGMYGLLKESGYFEMNNQIQAGDIEQVLEMHPHYISDWMNWSENKRTDSGWFFKKVESGKYEIGYASQNGNANIRQYVGKAEACATFIKLEIEDIINK
jgi:hypothetical protein